MAKYVECGLLGMLDRNWMKIPLQAARESGPAAQTLAGMLEISGRETFRCVKEIARTGRSKPSTTRKHLLTLVTDGWLEDCGREKTRRGYARRTVTYRITPKSVPRWPSIPSCRQ